MRRTLPAMGAALAAFVAIRVAVYEWVRPHLMAPLVSRSLFEFATPRRVMIGGNLPQGAWVVSEDYVNRAGQAVPWNDLIGNANTVVGPHGVSIGGVGSCSNITASGTISPTTANDLVQRCINQLHITSVVSYQPPSRYWPFQTYESLIFVGLALAVGAFAVWWVRRLD
jgi:hypothetical protein